MQLCCITIFHLLRRRMWSLRPMSLRSTNLRRTTILRRRTNPTSGAVWGSLLSG